MPLSPSTLESAITAALTGALISAFGPSPDPSSHKTLAEAIAKGISGPIVTTLLSAQVIVQPGQATAGSPAAQTTVSPGTGNLI